MIPSCSADLRLSFALFSLGAWSAFFLWSGCGSAAGEELIFALATTTTAFLLLKALGYFNRLKLRPRKSDLLFVVIANTMATSMQYALVTEALGLTICPLPSLMIGAPIIASIVFAAHYVTSTFVLSQRRPRKVMLDLLPTEAVRIIADFAGLGVDRFIEFVSAAELSKYLETGRDGEISLIIISRGTASEFGAKAELLRAHLSGVPIIDFLKASADLTGRVRLADADLWSYIIGAKRQTLLLRAYSIGKMVFEPIVAILLAFVFAPLMLLIAISIKITSAGPIFYRQSRTGYLGNIFTLIKFRSMQEGAEKNGAQWSHFGDRRITAFGKLLRATRLDELPQLWNVMNGEMSFFGPRPERPEMYAELQKEIPLFTLRTLVRPGISGWAQVCAGYASSMEESRRKLEFDLYYIQHMSPRLDAIILIKTLQMFLPRSRIINMGSDARERYARAT